MKKIIILSMCLALLFLVDVEIRAAQGTIVLSDTTPDTNISAGATAKVYGTSGINRVTIESGAKAQLINFPGNNAITIQIDSSLFTVSRSGGTVTFEGSDGTLLKIPATTSIQTISFNDQTLTLTIDNNQVMLDDQEIGLSKAPIGQTADDMDWSNGNWGIKVTQNGAVTSSVSNVTYPIGSKSGKALEIYYRMTDMDIPQFWVFLTDGFWRQHSYGSPFGTSYRLFRYYSSSDAPCDKITATGFNVIGTNAENQLEIEFEYENNASAGDRFEISARVLLLPPDAVTTAMNATVTVVNAGDHDITPYWEGHRALGEQWELFEISSMYVADNLSGGIPLWYDLLDPEHQYVGITTDDKYDNDGNSLNGGDLKVYTHDIKTIIAGDQSINLDYETCPSVIVPEALDNDGPVVMLDQVSDSIEARHLYESGRDHVVELLSCSGITEDITNLKWSATYNREDANMVDGDNIQIRLGMDDFLNIWPKGASQTIVLNLKAGRANNAGE